MHKNTDSHLKTRTVTVTKRFGELPQVLCPVQKKGFLRTQELTFLVRYFWVFNRGHQAGGPLTSCFVL
jgi:hypothetical protein